jgi:hypothetical protein
MFISDKIVFLELQKTGCTHIRNLLAELVGGKKVGKHNQAGHRLFSDGKIFLGSVRDPWDWYVSLWAFGCHHKGTVYGNVIKEGIKFKGRGWRTDPYAAVIELLHSRPNKIADKWKRTYKDVNDPGAFREWLGMMHDKEFRPDVEGYAHSGVGRVAGFLTYCYLKTFACKKGHMNDLNAIASTEQLMSYEQEHCFIDYFIRNEHLEADLLDALKQAGYTFTSDVEAKVLSRPKTNTTSRKRKLDYFYDASSERLINEWDRLVVEKFDYTMPSLRDMPHPVVHMPNRIAGRSSPLAAAD